MGTETPEPGERGGVSGFNSYGWVGWRTAGKISPADQTAGEPE